jgi:hypothetical protein
MRLVLICLSAVAAASCSPQPAPGAAADASPYNTDMDVQELMVHVMEPAAYGFWNGWGMIINAEGTFDISPRTERDWKGVENGAATVIAATNTLLLPAYIRQPEAEWRKAAKAVADIAKEGKDAAERQDKQAMYDLGARLDEACDACHSTFAKDVQQ